MCGWVCVGEGVCVCVCVWVCIPMNVRMGKGIIVCVLVIKRYRPFTKERYCIREGDR